MKVFVFIVEKLGKESDKVVLLVVDFVRDVISWEDRRFVCNLSFLICCDLKYVVKYELENGLFEGGVGKWGLQDFAL